MEKNRGVWYNGNGKEERGEKKERLKRNVKNSVFIDIFEQDVYRLQLFQTLHPEMTDVTAEDIQTVTLKQVVTNHQYNDLAFIVKDRLMVFVEAQSTWSVNILIRILLYLADTIQAYLHDREMDIHDTRKLEIPRPEFYIIYTGEPKVPEMLSIGKDFFGDSACPLDLRAKVFSTETRDIIGQYIVFCRVLDDQRKKLGPVKEAAAEAIRICRDRGVLANYLREREKEVFDIMITLFDQEYAVEQYGRSQHKRGLEQGISQGLSQGLSQGISQGISQAVAIYRDEMNLSNTEIVGKIAGRFNISKDEAQKFVEG